MNEQAALDELFGMMKIAKTQQETVKTALDGLAAERAALAKERAAVAQAAASVAGVAGDVKRAATEAIPAIQRAAGEAVGASVRESLAGASVMAVAALDTASKPVIDRLSGVARAAGEAEGKLSGAVASFHWKWAFMAGGLSVCSVAGVLIAAWLLVWWERHQVESLSEQKAALQVDVAELQANVAKLEKRGGRIVMSECGGRLCIEASSNQGKGAEQWNGSFWNSKGTGVPLVIPRGY